MRIVLLRHGQTTSNVTHALDTVVPGPALTALGERQAAAVPAALAGEDVGAVWASTATRAQQTAGPLAASLGLDVGVLDGLREVEAGELEMRTDEAAVRRYVEVVVSWGRGDLGAAIPGAEDGASVLARYDAAVEQVAAAAAAAAAAGAGCAVAVSHGAVIRFWTAARVDGVDVGSMAQRWMENTGAVIIERPEDGADGAGDGARPWRLVEWHGEPLGGPDLAPDRDQEGPIAPPPAQVVTDATVTEGSAPEQ